MLDFKDTAVRTTIQRGIKEAINNAASARRENRYATRISPSSLGQECTAEVWYNWRWALAPSPQDGRVARYNERGEKNEDDITAWLREIGFTVRDKDERGQQLAVSDLGGHLYGKIDGEGSHPKWTEGQTVLLEYKYINYKRYQALTKEFLQTADEKYYSQVCLYMYYRNLPACLFIPCNRNDEDFEPLVIPRDDTQVALLLEKAASIMNSPVRPARISESPAFFRCKSMCNYTGICHRNEPIAKNCRSCLNCVPIDGGKFHCNKWNATIPNKQAILAGCEQWNPVQ